MKINTPIHANGAAHTNPPVPAEKKENRSLQDLFAAYETNAPLSSEQTGLLELLRQLAGICEGILTNSRHQDIHSSMNTSMLPQTVTGSTRFPLRYFFPILGAVAGSFMPVKYGAILFCALGTAALFFTKRKDQRKDLPHSLSEKNAETDLCQKKSLYAVIHSILERVYKPEPVPEPDETGIPANTPSASLDNLYVSLLERLQYLLGADAPEELRQQRDNIRKSLAGYGYAVIDYTGTENEAFFEFRSSAHVCRVTPQLPAIMKAGRIVLPGSILMPQ